MTTLTARATTTWQVSRDEHGHPAQRRRHQRLGVAAVSPLAPFPLAVCPMLRRARLAVGLQAPLGGAERHECIYAMLQTRKHLLTQLYVTCYNLCYMYALCTGPGSTPMYSQSSKTIHQAECLSCAVTCPGFSA